MISVVAMAAMALSVSHIAEISRRVRGRPLRLPTFARDHARVHACGGEPACDARVFHFHTAVDDDVEAGIVCQPDGFLIDDAVLEPDRFGTDLDGLHGDRHHFFCLSKYVHDVGRPVLCGARGQRLVARRALNIGVCWIDRPYFEPVRGQISKDEVAGPHRVGASADHEDYPAPVEQGPEICVSRQDHFAAPAAVARAAALRPPSRSQIKSSTSSSPTDSRTMSGVTPALSISSSDNCACVVEAGWITRLFASPTLARW